eukprot:g36694.t1
MNRETANGLTSLTEAGDAGDLQFKCFFGCFKETVPLFVMAYGQGQQGEREKDRKLPSCCPTLGCDGQGNCIHNVADYKWMITLGKASQYMPVQT